MVSMKACNFVVFIVGIFLGGGIMGSSARFPMEITEQGPGPGFWPFLLGLALAIAAVILAVYTLFHRQELAEEQVALGTAANRQVYVIMGMIAAFCVLVRLIGFYPAALLLIPCIMYRLECRNKKRMLLTALCVTLFIYLVFGQLLHTSLPSSVFLE
ncbi:MAG TPA: hypothetical protein DEG55_02015 [Acidaminococcaceae bacterium]|nr:hypothetical protein [Acidaminococcaceae bacterium]